MSALPDIPCHNYPRRIAYRISDVRARLMSPRTRAIACPLLAYSSIMSRTSPQWVASTTTNHRFAIVPSLASVNLQDTLPATICQGVPATRGLPAPRPPGVPSSRCPGLSPFPPYRHRQTETTRNPATPAVRRPATAATRRYRRYRRPRRSRGAARPARRPPARRVFGLRGRARWPAVRSRPTAVCGWPGVPLARMALGRRWPGQPGAAACPALRPASGRQGGLAARRSSRGGGLPGHPATRPGRKRRGGKPRPVRSLCALYRRRGARCLGSPPGRRSLVVRVRRVDGITCYRTGT